MDLFGIREHDACHDDVARQLRRRIERVTQFGIDLEVTRTELRKLDLVVESKVSNPVLDPSFLTTNEGIKAAKGQDRGDRSRRRGGLGSLERGARRRLVQASLSGLLGSWKAL